MHSFIVEGGDLDSRSLYIQDLLSTPTELIHLVAEKSSLTIKQVQDLNGPLSISPRLPRIIWIEEANLLTIPSQNALLKMLEEPPSHTTFYLTCQRGSVLLPTIRSRAKSLHLPATTQIHDPAILAELKLVMTLSPGDRLSSIIKRDRSGAILWITQIETSLNSKLQDPHLSPVNYQTLAKIARLALNTHTALLANCNLSLTIQNFYLLLPHVLQ